jgi:hypothetical protein
MEELIADRHALGRGFTYLSPGNYSTDTGLNGFSRVLVIQDTRVDGQPAKSVTLRIVKSGTSDVSLTATLIENW